MAILALIMTKRYQRAKKGQKTAQRLKEVMKVETQNLIKALKEKAEADQRVRERILTRVTMLEAAVANLAKKVTEQGMHQVTLKDRILIAEQEQGKAQVERVLLRNRILDLEKAVSQLITANQVK
jgi:hypothetical protein